MTYGDLLPLGSVYDLVSSSSPRMVDLVFSNVADFRRHFGETFVLKMGGRPIVDVSLQVGAETLIGWGWDFAWPSFNVLITLSERDVSDIEANFDRGEDISDGYIVGKVFEEEDDMKVCVRFLMVRS